MLNRAQGLFLPLLDLNNQFFVAALLLVGGYQVLRAGAGSDIGNLVGFLVHGHDVLLADHDARQAIQSSPDGDGCRRARVHVARHAARLERAADRQTRWS